MADEKNNKDIEKVEIMKRGEAPSSDEKKVVLARHVFPAHLPIVPLNGHPVFPRMTVPMVISDEKLKKMLIETAQSQSRFVGLILKREHEGEEVSNGARAKDLHEAGVVAEILQMAQLAPGEPVHVMLGAHERFRIEAVLQEDPHIVVRVAYMTETEMAANEDLKAYSVSVVQSIKELVQLNPLHKEELSLFMSRSNLNEPGRLADFAAAMTTASGKELQDVLETLSIRARLKKVLVLLRKEIDISKIQVKISKQIEDKLSKQQREFFLREQFKAIKKELGLAKEGKEAETERFEKRVTLMV